MGSGIKRCAIWARVSTEDQKTSNQLDDLRAWAADRGLQIVQEFILDASAWTAKNGAASEFDKQRSRLLDGATFGSYEVVLTWAVDRLSRRGAEDMLAFVRRLTGTGCALWSRQDPWVESMTDPFAREILLSLFGTIARFESERRSERVKAGIATRRKLIESGKLEGHVGGRKPGAKDRSPRSTDGYRLRWERERKQREKDSASA